jgi:hypothetical protein
MVLISLLKTFWANVVMNLMFLIQKSLTKKKLILTDLLALLNWIVQSKMQKKIRHREPTVLVTVSFKKIGIFFGHHFSSMQINVTTMEDSLTASGVQMYA